MEFSQEKCFGWDCVYLFLQTLFDFVICYICFIKKVWMCCFMNNALNKCVIKTNVKKDLFFVKTFVSYQN